jgi:serine/threonine-protein kinase RsbW
VSQQRDLDEDLQEIRLTLPALTSYARVARLAMTGLASRTGFSYDEVEDLRIAVGEVFGLLVADDRPEGQVRLRCRSSDDRLEILASRSPVAPIAEVTELSRQILGAVVDEATIDGPQGAITITKRLGATS